MAHVWNRSRGKIPSKKPKGMDQKPLLIRGVVAGLLVVAIAIGCYFTFISGIQKPILKTSVERCGSVKELKTIKTPKKIASPSLAKPLQDEETIKERCVTIVRDEKPVITNRTVYSTNCVTRPPDPNDPDTKLITSVNQEIGSLLSTELGEQPIPFPYSFQVKNGDNGNDAFLEALKAKIVFRDTDTEEKLNFKTKLLDSQIELIDSIKEGLSFNDSMEEAYKLRVRAYETRKCLIAELSNMRESDPDIVEDGLNRVNESLAAQGIKKISREDIGLDEYNEEE